MHRRKPGLLPQSSPALLNNVTSVYNIVVKAIALETAIALATENHLSHCQVDYELIYAGSYACRLLPSFDCPANPFTGNDDAPL
jgi:hypothetical protein